MEETRPWKVYEGTEISPMFSGIVCMISASDRIICVISEDEKPVYPDDWPAVARLIAAAPDMLAALKDLVREDDHFDDFLTALKRARTAIAKAEGSLP